MGEKLNFEHGIEVSTYLFVDNYHSKFKIQNLEAYGMSFRSFFIIIFSINLLNTKFVILNNNKKRKIIIKRKGKKDNKYRSEWGGRWEEETWESDRYDDVSMLT